MEAGNKTRKSRDGLTAGSGAEGHPSAEAVAQYLDDTLSSVERDALENHLSDCQRCRDEIVESRVTIRRLKNRRNLLIAVPITLAASLAIVVPMAMGHKPELSDQYRAQEQTNIIQAVEPSGNAPIVGDSIQFVWSVANAVNATFVLSVTDSAGNLLHEITTADTVVLVPRTTISETAGSFFWFVDALFENGRSAKSEIYRFLVS